MAAVWAFPQPWCATHPGLVVRLMQRVGTASGAFQAHTWMEIYSSTDPIALHEANFNPTQATQFAAH